MLTMILAAFLSGPFGAWLDAQDLETRALVLLALRQADARAELPCPGPTERRELEREVEQQRVLIELRRQVEKARKSEGR